MAENIEEKFKKLLFEKYEQTKKNLLSKEEYFKIIEEVKTASSLTSTKQRKQYYQLSK